jgi:hypothetical protein
MRSCRPSVRRPRRSIGDQSFLAAISARAAQVTEIVVDSVPCHAVIDIQVQMDEHVAHARPSLEPRAELIVEHAVPRKDRECVAISVWSFETGVGD